MKKIFILVLITIFSLSMFAFEKAPDFSLKDIKNKNISLKDIPEGNLIILDFWASWCQPCKKGLIKINELAEKYDNVTLVMVSIDKPRTMNKAKSYFRQKKYSAVCLFDPNSKVAKSYGVTTVPRSFVLDTDRNVIMDHSGYKSGDEKHVEEIIQKWLKDNEKK